MADAGWREALSNIKDEPTKLALRTMIDELNATHLGLREELDATEARLKIAELQVQQNGVRLQTAEQQVQQHEERRAAGGGSTAKERWEKKMASALRTMPKYEHHSGNEKGRSWSTYLMERRDWIRVMQYQDESDFFLKNALLYSLKGTAKDMSNVIGTEEEISNMTCEQVLKLLTELYEPPAEAQLKKQEFKSLKQSKNEDIVHYFATKESLWAKAYPLPAERSLEILIDSCIEGICSRTVKKKMYEQKYLNKMTTFADARRLAVSIVSSERNLMQQGLSDSVNMDGLRPATICQDRDRADNFGDGSEAMEIGAIAEKSCYICGKKGHLKKDCPSKMKKGKKPTGKFEGECRRCGRKGHKGASCYAKKHKSGKELKPNKNQVKNIAEGENEVEVDSSSDSE